MQAQAYKVTTVQGYAVMQLRKHKGIRAQVNKIITAHMRKRVNAQVNKLFKYDIWLNENDYFCTDFGDGLPSASTSAGLFHRLWPSFNPGSV